MQRSAAIVLGCLLVGAGALADRLVLAGKPGDARAGNSDDVREELADVKSALQDLRRSVERGGGGTKTVLVAAPPVAAEPSPCPGDAKPADEAARLERQRNHPAWQDAETLVASAIARGRWTEADIERFRQLAREAPDVDMVPLMQRIDVAINTRRLRPDPDLIELH
jgi:hypothetical protein